MSTGPARVSNAQLIVAVIASLVLEIVGFLAVTQSTGDIRTFGWFLVVLGALFTGLNLAMRRMR